MAKVTDDGEDFGNPDIDDLDWGDPLEDAGSPGKDRKPVERFGHGFLKGVQETAKTPSLYTNALRTALPEGYSASFQLGEDVARKSQELYNEVSKDLGPAAKEMKRLLRTAKASANSYLPEKLSKKLDEWLKEEERPKSGPKYDPTESAITSELGEIFKAQVEQSETERAEEAVRDAVEKKRFNSQYKQLDEIRRLLNKQTAYQDSVNVSYQRKSLEISMRQMFIQRDLLEVTKAGVQETVAQLRDITKNTGLPEVVKIQNSEIFEQLAKERLMGKVADRFAPQAREIFNRISKSIFTRVKELTGNIRDGVDSAAMMHDSMEGMDGFDALLESGKMAGSYAMDWGAQKVAKWAKPKLGENSTVRAKGNELLFRTQNWDQLLKKRMENNIPTTWFGEMIQESVLAALRFGGRQKIGNDSIAESTAPTIWDNLSRKSLVEIIPGFLARILQSSEGIRTKGEVPLMTYDHDRNEFTTVKGLSERIKKRLVTDDDLSRLSEDGDEIIDLFDKNKEIAPETRNKVKQFLIRELKANRIADFERFTDHYSYRNLGMSGNEIDQVVELLQSGLGMDWSGKLGTDADSTELKQKFAQKMRRLQANLPQFTERANMYANTTNMEALRDAGVVRKVMDEDHLNQEYFDNRFRQFLQGEQPDADSSHQSYPGSVLDSYNNDLRHGDSSTGASAGGSGRARRAVGSSDLYGALETLRTQLSSENERQILALEALVAGSTPGMDTLTNAVKEASSREEAAETNRILKELLEAFDELRATGLPIAGGGSFSDSFNTAGIRSTLQGGSDYVRGKGREFANKASEFGKTATTAGADLLQSAMRFAPQISGVSAEDIWQQLDPVKLKAGKYRDLATGKVISSFNDISGVVADLSEKRKGVFGNIRDSVSNAYGQVSNSARNFKMGSFKDAFSSIRNRMTGAAEDLSVSDKFNSAKEAVAGGYTSAVNYIKNIDLETLKNAPKIVGDTAEEIWEQLDPVKVQMGAYRDSITGKVIETVDDIKQKVSDVSEVIQEKKEKLFGNRNRAKAFARRFLGRGLYGLLGGAFTAGKFGAEQIGKGFGDLGRFAKLGYRGLKNLSYGKIGRTLGTVGGAALRGAGALGKYGISQIGKGFGDLKNLGLGAARLLGKIPRNGGLKRLAGAGIRGIGNVLSFGGRQLGKGFGDLRKILGGAGRLLTGGLPFFGGAKKVVKALDRIYDLLVRFFAFKGMSIDQLKADGVDDKTGKITIRQRLKSVYDRMRENKGAWAQRIAGWKDSLAKYRKKGNAPEEEKPEEESKGKGWLGTLLGVITGLGGTITSAFGSVGKLITGRLTWLGEYLAARMAAGAIVDGISDASLPDGDADTDKDGKKKGRKKLSRWQRIKAKVGIGGRGAAAARTGGTIAASQGARMAGTAAATTAGRAAVAAGVGGAAMAAGGTLAAIAGFLLSAPVMIAVAVGTAGYYTYKYFKEKLDPFQKLRIAQYGIPLDERDAILKIFETEHELSKHVKWEGDIATNIAEGFDMEAILTRFDVNVRDPQSLKGFTVWFNQRFKPIFLRYLSAMKQLTPGVPIHELDSKIKPEQMQAMLTALKIPATQRNHPYMFTLSPFENIDIVQGTTEIDDAATEIANIIKANKHKEKSNEIKSRVEPLKPGATITDMMKLDAEKRKAAEAKAILVSSGSPTQRAEMREQVAMLEQQKSTQTGVAAAITQHRIDEKNKFMGKAFYEYEKAKPKDEKWIATLEQDTQNFKAAVGSDAPTDGYYSKIPVPTGDGSWDAVKDTILTVAAYLRVNPATLANFAKVESGFQTRVKAKTSSATGLFQFINSTWRGMMDKYGDSLGIPKDAKPTDPVASTLLAAQFIKLNNEHLRNKLGREPSMTDSYMAHFLGPAGAAKFLAASPSAIAAEVMPSAASANRSIFYGPSGPRTVSEVYALMGNKINGSTTSPVRASSKRLVDQQEVAKALNSGTSLSSSMTTAKVHYDKSSGKSTAIDDIVAASAQSSASPIAVTAAVTQTASPESKPTLRRTSATVQTTPAERMELRSRQLQEQSKLVAETQANAMSRAASILEESLKVQHAINTGIREIGSLLKTAITDKPAKVDNTPLPQTAATEPAKAARPVVESPQAPMLLRRNV